MRDTALRQLFEVRAITAITAITAISLPLWSACNSAVLPDPIPEHLEPSRSSFKTVTPVAIFGRHFEVQTHVSYADDNSTMVDAEFTVYLGDTVLLNPTWIGPSEIHATVPATLPPGTHDLKVVSPWGRAGMLTAAFVVTAPGTDADGDGTPDKDDVCPGFDDRLDLDSDGLPDGCDICPGFDDNDDDDGDGIPNGCDVCPSGANPPIFTDWWDDDWKSRLPLTVNEAVAGSLASGYTVAAVLDSQTMIAAGQLLDSGDDLRVVWVGDDRTMELDRRIVDIGTPHTLVWFKTQDPVTDSDSAYAIYFDNPTAADPPAHWADSMGNGAIASAVYLAGDNFEDDAVGSMPDGWEGSAQYTVIQNGSNKVLEVESDGPSTADYLFAGDFNWGNIVVSARLSIQNTSGDYYGIFVRSQPGRNFYSGYFGTATNDSTLQFWEMTIADPAAQGSSAANLRRSSDVDALGTDWRTLEVAMEGRDLHFFLDDEPRLYSYTVDRAYQTGRMGLCVGYAAGKAYWDDIVVRAYVAPEPEVVIQAAQSTRCQ